MADTAQQYTLDITPDEMIVIATLMLLVTSTSKQEVNEALGHMSFVQHTSIEAIVSLSDKAMVLKGRMESDGAWSVPG